MCRSRLESLDMSILSTIPIEIKQVKGYRGGRLKEGGYDAVIYEGNRE